MTVSSLLDSAGRRRSPATLPGYRAGRPPRNKGMLYPADPPTVEEIVSVMRHACEDPHGWRIRAMIVILWRGGLRVQEALALNERDLDPQRGSVLVRCGKGGRRREVGMDPWGWENLRPWLSERLELPAGRLFCVINGPTRGRPWSAAAVRPSSVATPPRRVSDDASRLINCVMRTPSSWLARGSRSTSSSASLATPTSARRASTCRASTSRRSSPPCTHDAHP